ncbi:hypothetical protein C6502_02855 [Candidatus Poribacteria bacterium]|nr:MAG: hypothetical protein C6502_02855 [Candidatus Poribacteria bacterium]
MRLSWNEIRARAAAFAQEWADAGYEKGQTQLFYRDFFDIFGMPVRRVATFEEPVRLLGDRRGFIDLFWKGVLLVEQKSEGRDLTQAREQALSYFPGISDVDLPRYLLLSDFQTFELYDLDEDESAAFTLAELPQHVEKFGFILGVQRRSFRDQDPVNIKASERVGQLHDALEESGYTGHDLEQFLVRIVFCFFADARGMAHVHVIIIGLSKRGAAAREKWLFSYETVTSEPHESHHTVLSPYLFDASGLTDPQIVVKEESRQINGLPKLIIGSKPIDGGHYIFKPDERAVFLQEEPEAEPYLRPYVGSREFLQGGERWILRLAEVAPQVLRTLPKVRERIAAVRAYRLASKSKPTQALAETPTLYHVNVVPEVSSERRDYIPIGWLEPPVIPSNKIRVLPNATLWQFGLLTSAMHMAWVRNIGRRLKSDFSYGIGIIYNTFPMPPVPAERLQRLEPYADAVLAARAAYPDATLADLYDPDLMPVGLRRAHRDLDRAVDRLYRRSPFSSDRERVEHLLGLYEKMMVPLAANTRPQRRRRRR